MRIDRGGDELAHESEVGWPREADLEPIGCVPAQLDARIGAQPRAIGGDASLRQPHLQHIVGEEVRDLLAIDPERGFRIVVGEDGAADVGAVDRANRSPDALA